MSCRCLGWATATLALGALALSPVANGGQFVTNVAVCALTFADDKDPLPELIAQYEQSVSTIRGRNLSKAEMDQWRRGWLTRLFNAAAAHPDSTSYTSALRKCLGLANGLSDYKRSESIIVLMLASPELPPDQFAGLQHELGELLSLRTFDPKAAVGEDEKRQLLERAAEAHAAAAQSAAPHDPTCVAALLSLARLQRQSGDAAGALESLTEATRRLSAMPEPRRREALPGTSKRALLQNTLTVALEAKDLDVAKETFHELIDGQDSNDSSQFVMEYATGVYAASPDEFEEFVSSWLKSTTDSAGTAKARISLGRMLMDHDRSTHALPYLDYVFEKQRNSLSESEKDKPRAGKRTQVGELYIVLATCLLKLEQADRARKIIDEGKALFPSDNRFEQLKRMNKRDACSTLQEIRYDGVGQKSPFAGEP